MAVTTLAVFCDTTVFATPTENQALTVVLCNHKARAKPWRYTINFSKTCLFRVDFGCFSNVNSQEMFRFPPPESSVGKQELQGLSEPCYTHSTSDLRAFSMTARPPNPFHP